MIPAHADSGIWHDRAFVLFWTARVVSISGSTITAVVLPILVFQLTGSALQTALLAILEVLPYFAFGLIAGALADRVDRRRIMVGCNLIQALLVASIPVAAALGALTLTQISVVVVLVMTAFVWFDAADFGALPALVGASRWSLRTAPSGPRRRWLGLWPRPSAVGWPPQSAPRM